MKCYGKTDIGAKRKNNQDSFSIVSRSGYTLAVVCDGMGGAHGGNVASSTAVHTFCASVREAFANRSSKVLDRDEAEAVLREAASDANAEVFRKASEDASLEGMGTTLVAVLLCKTGNYAINIGDSRLYLQKGTQLQAVTKDNSFIQYLLDKGLVTPEEAAVHPNRNIILRALGVNEEVEADFYEIPPFDHLLLCSDGLYNLVSSNELCALMSGAYAQRKRAPGLRTRVQEMVRRANQNGGPDNITAILIG